MIFFLSICAPNFCENVQAVNRTLFIVYIIIITCYTADKLRFNGFFPSRASFNKIELLYFTGHTIPIIENVAWSNVHFRLTCIFYRVV